MSFRALTAAALLTAMFGGNAAGQYPPDAAPLGGAFGTGPHYPNFPAMPGADGPAIVPVQGRCALPVDAGSPTSGSFLPTDSLGGFGARGPKCWVGVEYLTFWTKDAPISVPIATVGPANGNALLGGAGTQVLFGGTELDYKNFSGVRVAGGYWFSAYESLGLEGSFFILPQKNSNTPALFGSDLLPTLARPFTNAANNQPNSRVLSRPGVVSGAIQVTGTQELWGGDLTGVWRFRDTGTWTVDALAGAKYLNLDESLTITDFAMARSGSVAFRGRTFPPPAANFVTDEITTENRFFGGVLGLRSNLHYEAFTFSLTGKLALGNMEQKVTAAGTTTLLASGPPVTSPGGFFALANNSGTATHEEFIVIPEFGTNLNVQVTSHLAVNFGFTYLYINQVVRPGDQLNTRINPGQLPSSASFGTAGVSGGPIPFNSTDFWAYGFNLGFALGY